MIASAKSLAKRGLELVDPIVRWHFRTTHGFRNPIPPMRYRARTGGRFVRQFVGSGRRCATALEDALRATTGKQVYDYTSVLDFGCGCGRTILHWRMDNFHQFTGCDVDRVSVEWLARHFPGTEFVTNRFDPPLPFRDGQFDLVYALSLFSHFALHDQEIWLDELLRVARPGGIVMPTIQGEHALRVFQGVPQWRRPLKDRSVAQEGFIYEPYPNSVLNGGEYAVGVQSEIREVTYGLTFMSPEFIRSRWTKAATVLGIFEGTVDNLQDVVVLQKHGS
jgi:SAM-dependent methyltransferase